LGNEGIVQNVSEIRFQAFAASRQEIYWIEAERLKRFCDVAISVNPPSSQNITKTEILNTTLEL